MQIKRFLISLFLIAIHRLFVFLPTIHRRKPPLWICNPNFRQLFSKEFRGLREINRLLLTFLPRNWIQLLPVRMAKLLFCGWHCVMIEEICWRPNRDWLWDLSQEHWQIALPGDPGWERCWLIFLQVCCHWSRVRPPDNVELSPDNHHHASQRLLPAICRWYFTLVGRLLSVTFRPFLN